MTRLCDIAQAPSLVGGFYAPRMAYKSACTFGVLWRRRESNPRSPVTATARRRALSARRVWNADTCSLRDTKRDQSDPRYRHIAVFESTSGLAA